MEKRQSAIEWFNDQVHTNGILESPDTDKGMQQRFMLGLILEQAEQKFRLQIEDAFLDGDADAYRKNQKFNSAQHYFHHNYGTK